MNASNPDIWIDHRWVPWQSANTHLLTHSLHYGFGVFESLRAYHTETGQQIFRLQAHVDRLFHSAALLDIEIPSTAEEVHQVSIDILSKNALDTAYIRLLVFYGAKSLALKANNEDVHLMIAAWHWPDYPSQQSKQQGVHLKIISSVRRLHQDSALYQAKNTGHYFSSILALQAIQKTTYDDVLMLDEQGYLSESSAANLFIVNQGQLLTPAPTHCLNGITRQTVCSLAQHLGIQVIEYQLSPDALYHADEVFLTGTLIEIQPVVSVDKRCIGTGKPGVITKKLQQCYIDTVHAKNIAFKDWCTAVPIKKMSQLDK